MTQPDKFDLMRRGRERARERALRETIDRCEREEVATWGPLKLPLHTGPRRSTEPTQQPRLPKRWLRWPFWNGNT
jgi:hypothetical protein